jgi:hypothetical protein
MLRWTGNSFAIRDVEYVCRPLGVYAFPSEPGRFCLLKPRDAVEAFEHLLQDLRPRTIIEIGMNDGASTAFFADLAQPEKIVGVDRRHKPGVALDDFIERRHLGSVVRPYYDVDQGDESRLREIVDSEFDEPVDVIIDDASHLLDLTRRTFNLLFPALRPGGTYVIEDWWWAHAARQIWPDEMPLTLLVFELLLVCAYEPEIVANVTASRDWALVTRGSATLDDTFDVSASYGERGRALLPPPSDVGEGDRHLRQPAR